MKKLLIAMGCFAAIVLMSSCTADSPVDASKQNSITPNKVPVPGTSAVTDGVPIKDISH